MSGTGPPPGERGRVVLVCGPPCAGKTSWARQHAQPGERVVDFDEICQALGSPSRFDHPPAVRALARSMRRSLEDAAADQPGTTYVTRSLPAVADRDAVAARLGARVVMLAVPAEEAIARAHGDGRPGWTEDVIRRWWDRYQPSTRDERQG